MSTVTSGRGAAADPAPAAVMLAVAAWKSVRDVTVLYVPWNVAPRLPNRTRGRHWAALAEVDGVAKLAALAAWAAAGWPEYGGAVRVDVLRFGDQAADADGVLAALKPVADVLFARRREGARWVPGRLAPDDGPRWVQWGEVRQPCPGPAWAGNRGWVVLIVRRQEEASGGGDV